MTKQDSQVHRAANHDPQVDTSTHINALLVVDLDGDGRNDIIGTLDRRTGSGLSDDRLVWYRNTRTEETDGE